MYIITVAAPKFLKEQYFPSESIPGHNQVFSYDPSRIPFALMSINLFLNRFLFCTIRNIMPLLWPMEAYSNFCNQKRHKILG